MRSTRSQTGEREHPPQPADGGAWAEGGDRLHDDLRVRPAAEAGAAPLELGAQIAVVVDLAVEDAGVASVARQHRLAARRGNIQHRQPAETERDATLRVGPAPRIVRATMDKRGGHARHCRIEHIRIAGGWSEPADEAAHGAMIPCLVRVTAAGTPPARSLRP